MDIIFMKPIYKDYIWGGEKLKKELNKYTPYENTAESWEISANENGICEITNEEYEGTTLKDLFNDNKIKEKIFGTRCCDMKEFPLLIKLIDARDNLSIQVHPDDQYAHSIGANNGKNEMWYIMDCDKDSQIVGGLNKKLTNKELKEIVENNQIKSYLNYINVKKGDSIYIPAGALHAILRNNLICEIQQNCDITYRVYDWDRVDKKGKTRELHKKQAIDTIKPEIIPEVVHSEDEKIVQNVVKNQYFQVDKINCIDNYEDVSDIDTFYAISVVEGQGIIETENQNIKIKKGDNFIIPATLGKYRINGKIELLKTQVV